LIDLVCQRHLLFPYDGNEYGPLLKTPRAFVVYARGGTYAEGSPTPASRFDHQKRYIDFWLKFIGCRSSFVINDLRPRRHAARFMTAS
jgi:FMN-dependent NADH-azoreductase